MISSRRHTPLLAQKDEMIETTATSQPWKPDLYVVARFLDIMFSNGSSMKKTNIQMLLGVNYPRFMDYLGWLLSHGLVATSIDEEGAEKIKLTPKGIDSYHRFVDWIKETMEGVKI